MATHTPLSPRARIIDAYIRGLNRANERGIKCYQHVGIDGVWDYTGDVTSASEPGKLYRVVPTGDDWSYLSCDCPGGGHICCRHRAYFAFVRRHNAWDVRDVVFCDYCDGRFCGGNCRDAIAPKCATCGTDPALPNNAQCAGCAAVYPDGQEAAERAELDKCPYCEQYKSEMHRVCIPCGFDPNLSYAHIERIDGNPRNYAVSNQRVVVERTYSLADIQAANQARNAEQEAAYKAEQAKATDAQIAAMRASTDDPLKGFWE